jgi:hypothetical protein
MVSPCGNLTLWQPHSDDRATHPAGAVRAPRLRVHNAGLPIGGAMSFSVNSNSFFQADVFSASFALYADPDFGLAWWGDEKWDRGNPLLVDIQGSLDSGATWTSLLLGQVDRQTVHLDLGVFEIEGRDLAANFIDAKAETSDFLNLTSSQIVHKLAASHGMSVDIDEAPTLSGRLYGTDRSITNPMNSTTSTQWNLLCTLRRRKVPICGCRAIPCISNRKRRLMLTRFSSSGTRPVHIPT